MKLPRGMKVVQTWIDDDGAHFGVRINTHNPLFWWDMRRQIFPALREAWRRCELTLTVFGRQIVVKRARD